VNARLAALKSLTTRLGGRVHLGVPEEGAAGRPALATGWNELDRLLGGGLPRGRVTEILGPASSGKLSLLLAALRAALQDGDTEPGVRTAPACRAALVDLSGTVFPGATWATGRLLVVRAPDLAAALRAADVLASSGALALLGLETGGLVPRGGLPEPVSLRLARLARETGTALVACGSRPLFGSNAGLRLAIAPTTAGTMEIAIVRDRTGRHGAAVVPRPSFPALPAAPSAPTGPTADRPGLVRVA
jgi:hypothetical protein